MTLKPDHKPILLAFVVEALCLKTLLPVRYPILLAVLVGLKTVPPVFTSVVLWFSQIVLAVVVLILLPNSRIV